MSYAPECTTPVLIAGAGPAGLTAAIALARQGVESLVVERKRELSSLPRATVISTRSMELLRSWGLEYGDPAPVGSRSSGRCWACGRSPLASAGSPIPVGLPSRQQSAVISPAAPECVPQDHTEPSAARATWPRSARPVWSSAPRSPGSTAGPDGARVVLRAAGGGPSDRPRPLRHRRRRCAQPVRSELGIADARARPVWRRPTAPFSAHHSGTWPGRPLRHLRHRPPRGRGHAPAGRPRRPLALRRALGAGPAGARGVPPRSGSPELIRLATGVADLQPQIERIGGFSFAAQLAERFRLRQRLPDRRRCPPRVPARRHRA